jgi:hypothetical protein
MSADTSTMESFATIFNRVANPVKPFGFAFVQGGLPLSALYGLHDFLGQLANLRDQLRESHPEKFQGVH